MAGSNLNDSVTLASTSIPSLSIMYPGQKPPPSSDGGFDDSNNNAAPAAPATLQPQQQLQQPQQQPYTSANPQIDALLDKAWETTQTANAQLNQHFSQQQQQQQPSLQPAFPTPLPLGTAPPADLTSESLLLQQQLARQTDEMQQYLQSEMAKLSTAIRQTAASIPEPAASPLQYTASAAAPQPDASPLTSLADVARIREAALSSFASQMASAQQPGYPLRPAAGAAASPVGARSYLPSASPQYHAAAHHTPQALPRRTQILTVEEAQKRLNSPIWDAEAVGNRAAASRPPQGAAVGGGGGGGGGAWDKRSSVSTATTSFPTVHMFDSVRSEPQLPQQQQQQLQQSVVLNPPSTSTASDAAAGNGGTAQTLVAALKHSLNHPSEATKAMGYAQMLAGIDVEKVVDVVHSYAQHLNRKEVSLTWRALVSQYQAAAAKGQPRTATLGGSQPVPQAAHGAHGHHGEDAAVFEREDASMERQFYEQDDSLPPTPKSSLKDSELSQEFQNDGYGTALKEVMSFIDKPLSPRTMARMEKIRQKTEQYGTSQSPARAPAGQQAPPALPNASPTAQVFAIPLDAPPAGFPNL
eukprot:Rhum_TRINITY_DN15412_c2_g1::Rhum_TRINITY_DN15412_c2_g1_i1::g.156472::m.156472